MVTKWDGGPIPSTAVNADNTTKVQEFTALKFQTQFTLTNFAYAVGTNSLRVSLNGATQRITTDVFETSPTVFTFDIPLEDGDIVYAEGLVGSVATQSAEASANAAAISATAAANYLAAIIALTPPALPLSIANGGTGQITKPLAFNALSPLTTFGDILAFNAGNNIRIPTAADGSILITEVAAPGGLRYYPEKPMLVTETMVDTTLQRADAGKLIVRSVPSPALTGTETIDLGANLYPGWKIWIENSDTVSPGSNSTGIVLVTLSGADTFQDSLVSTLSIPVGGCLGIECAGVVGGVGIFRVFTSKASRGYFKVRLQALAGVSLGVPVVGLNDRFMTTIVENTLSYTPVVGNALQLTKGTWQFRATTTHTGAANTRLNLHSFSGGAQLIAGLNGQNSNLLNVITGRITGGNQLVYFREYFSAAVGTLGTAINDGTNPEIYGEAEFWKE